MRILHVHERAGFFGGVEQILYDTAAGLAARGWQQALLHDDPAADDAFVAPFCASGRETELLRRFRPDVVLIHKPAEPGQAQAVSRAWPSVRMVHDHDLVCLRRHKYLPLNGRICEAPAGFDCYRNLCFINRSRGPGGPPLELRSVRARRRDIAGNGQVRRFIVGSRWMSRSLEGNGVAPDRLVVVHPVPAALATPRQQAPGEPGAILYVGQVIRGKGVDLLLRALALTPGAWRASIVGDGAQLDSCRRLAARLGLADRVHFAGRVPHEALEDYYRRASFTVVPSRWPEPFGMVGIEAMARGRPVVAFDAGGIEEWLQAGENGLLVPAGNETALARALGELLEAPDRVAELGAGAARSVAMRFSHQTYLDRMQEILEAAA